MCEVYGRELCIMLIQLTGNGSLRQKGSGGKHCVAGFSEWKDILEGWWHLVGVTSEV